MASTDSVLDLLQNRPDPIYKMINQVIFTATGKPLLRPFSSSGYEPKALAGELKTKTSLSPDTYCDWEDEVGTFVRARFLHKELLIPTAELIGLRCGHAIDLISAQDRRVQQIEDEHLERQERQNATRPYDSPVSTSTFQPAPAGQSTKVHEDQNADSALVGDIEQGSPHPRAFSTHEQTMRTHRTLFHAPSTPTPHLPW